MSNRTIRKADSQPDKPDIQADTQPDKPDNTIKFPPSGLYTAVAIAEILGCHESTVRNRWYPEIEAIYQVGSERLKSGRLFTQLAFDEFQKRQRYRDSQRPLLNTKNQIVRHESAEPGKLGLPVMEPNPNPLTKAEYRELRWSENPELKAPIREDSFEAVNDVSDANYIDGEIVHVEILPPVHDTDSVEQLNSTLDKIEGIGDSLSVFFNQLGNAAQLNADQASAFYLKEFTERFAQNIQVGQESLGKAMNGQRKSQPPKPIT